MGMATTPKPPTAQQLLTNYEISHRIRSSWLKDKSADRILSALGHPGYGDRFATRVLARMVKHNISAHDSIRQEIELDRLRELGLERY